MTAGLSDYVLDGLVRSLAKADDSFLRLSNTIDELSVTLGLWMPDEQPMPDQPSMPDQQPGRFNNLDWEERQ